MVPSLSFYYVVVVVVGYEARRVRPPELELQEVVSFLMWVLGIELRSSE